MTGGAAEALVAVEDLSIAVGDDGVEAVRGVSFSIRHGEIVGLVGESGSGKTLTTRAILGMLPDGCGLASGRIAFDGVDLTATDRDSWRELRGRRIGAVFQDPGSYLNPSLTAGVQLVEVLRVKRGMGRAEAREQALALLRSLGLRDAERVFGQLPGQLSGGMVQRLLIAVAIACDPDFLIADEATTALDVTVQAEVVEILRELNRERGLAMLFVSHDLALVADLCDVLVVLYGGEIVEMGPTDRVVAQPRHPYTAALLQIASLGAPRDGAEERLQVIAGRPPAPGEVRVGCRFAARCPLAVPTCVAADVALVEQQPGRWARCLRSEELVEGARR